MINNGHTSHNQLDKQWHNIVDFIQLTIDFIHDIKPPYTLIGIFCGFETHQFSPIQLDMLFLHSIITSFILLVTNT